MKQITVIDAPSDLGLRRTGVQGLPDALREAGLMKGIGGASYAGRLAVPAYVPRLQGTVDVTNAEAIAVFAQHLAERVTLALDHGQFPLVLGGDCSILLGSALALRRRGRFGLFFLDGHADFYSQETEVNGEAASMDLALALGRGPDALADLDGLRPLIRESDTVVFGVRDTALAASGREPRRQADCGARARPRGGSPPRRRGGCATRTRRGRGARSGGTVGTPRR